MIPSVTRARRRGEIGYAEITASHSTIPTTRTDVAGFTPISFDVLVGEVVYVEFFASHTTHGTAGLYLQGFISDNAGADAAAAVVAQGNTAGAATGLTCGSLRVVERIIAAGSYVRKPQALSITNANGAILAQSPNRKPFIRAWVA